MNLRGLIDNFAYIFANSRDVVNLFSLTHSRVLAQNAAALAAVGHPAVDQEGSVETHYPPEELPRLRESLDRLIEQGVSELRTRMFVKNGDLRHFVIRSVIVQREPEVVALVHTIDVTAESSPQTQPLIDFGFLVMKGLDDRDISLTPGEVKLLALFAEAPGHRLSRDIIIRRIWGQNVETRVNAFNAALHRLRKKLHQSGFDLENVDEHEYQLQERAPQSRPVAGGAL